MSKLRCQCGHTISDSVYPCPTEAAVIGNKAYEILDRAFTEEVADFLAASKNGNREGWVIKRFGDGYPKDISDSEVISDLLTYHFMKHSLVLSECEMCGRMWLQREPGENAYRSFVPDEGGFGRHLMVVGIAEIATNKPMDRSGGSADS